MEHSPSTKRTRGLGIQDLDIQNKCLLSKWLYKLCNEESLWQDLLRNKYLKHRTLSQTSKKNGEFTFFVKPDEGGSSWLAVTKLDFGKTIG